MDANQRTKMLVLILLIVLLGAMLQNLQGEYTGYGSAGTHDFIAYWSATRLILQGRNPYDRDALYRVEKGLGWPEERPWLVMNPPWLGIVLAPFGLLPFREAVFLWLLGNMLVMGLATYFLWQVFAIEANGRFLWAAMATAFLFPQTLSAIFSGQVSPLVLLGISGTLFYIERNRGFWAGAMLVLTTLKPQLICLLLPAIVLWSVRQKLRQSLIATHIAYHHLRLGHRPSDIGCSIVTDSRLAGQGSAARQGKGYNRLSPIHLLCHPGHPKVHPEHERGLLPLDALLSGSHLPVRFFGEGSIDSWRGKMQEICD